MLSDLVFTLIRYIFILFLLSELQRNCKYFTVSLKTSILIWTSSCCSFVILNACIVSMDKFNVTIQFTAVNIPRLWASGRGSGLRRRRSTARRRPQRRQEGRRRRSSAQNNAAFSTSHQTLRARKLCVIILQQRYLISSTDKMFITQQIIYRDRQKISIFSLLNPHKVMSAGVRVQNCMSGWQ